MSSTDGLTNESESKLILSDFYNDKLLGFYFYKEKLQRITHMDSESVVGNIYIGYVKDVVKNINAAFIEFGNDLKGYYSLNDNAPFFLNVKNNNKVCQGDKILVQVSGDKIKTKDYSLTSNINLTGKYCVLTVGNTNISISKKIQDKTTRNQLTRILDKYKNDEYGFIARTSAKDAKEQMIEGEIIDLINQLEEIKNKAMHLKGKSIVKENESILTKECQEFIDKENGIVITDKKQIFDELSKNKINCNFYDRDLPLFKCYSLEKHLMSGINKKVWLNSGAYLIIEPTEALTVIDVNTGKAELKSNKEETFYKINIEAAHEVARQLKIRNISGIIIVDFISMRNMENEQMLLNKMNEILKYDYSRCIAVDITKLGLMEITRKKGKKSLYEIIQK